MPSFLGVDFVTRCMGEDREDFDGLLTPACNNAVNSCFGDSCFRY